LQGRRSQWFGPPLVAFGALLWATDSLFRSPVAHRYPAVFIVFLNHWLCLVPMLPVLWRERRQLATFSRRDWTALAFVAPLGSVVAMACFTRAFATASNYTVPILMQKLQPLIAILLARVVLGERLTKSFPLWAALAAFGAYLVSFGWTAAWDSVAGARDLEPTAWALAAAAIWGATTVGGRLLLSGRNWLFVTAARFVFGAVFALVVVTAMGLLPLVPGAARNDVPHFLGMAFISGLLPLLIYYLGLQWTPASVATLCELAFPVAAIVLNWIFLGSPLSPAQMAGAALLLLAITALSLAGRTPTPALSAQLRAP
jgi:drug/metabolite transporter (DMT)-like permease